MSRHLLTSATLTLALLCGCTSSNDSDADSDGAGGETASEEEGLQMCCELGALCHVAGESSDADVADCHDIGHRNQAEDCVSEYDRCLEVCAGTNDEPVEHACE